jgi:hypothetical protein
LERMISEPTGEMRQVEGTVILEGLECLCWNATGGCPRGEFAYWREVWLERCGPGAPRPEFVKVEENVPHDRP